MNSKKIHIIGIGGIGISALARHYLHEGWQVSGSDVAESINSKKLEAVGIKVVYKQSAENITDRPDLDLVVYSDGVTAETAGWGELEAARESGVRTLNYFEALAEIANEYYVIAVAGTHGKTTVTAMLADILEEANYDPTVVVGSLRTKTGTNYRPGKSKYFVVEADEYLRHFLQFNPDVLIINNIDFDHPDYFVDLADVQHAFTELVAKVPDAGAVICDTSDAKVQPVYTSLTSIMVDYREYLDLGLSLKQPGLHNRMNAAAASAAAAFIGVTPDVITKALANYAGTWRRFEYKGDVKLENGQSSGAPVYDDYAHNPQKVAAAIAGARELYPDKRLVVIFQPHTYSRTHCLFNEFAKSFAGADRMLLLPIYAAREENTNGVSSRELAVRALEYCPDTSFVESFTEVTTEIKSSVSGDDVVLVLGAGDVTQVAIALTQ